MTSDIVYMNKNVYRVKYYLKDTEIEFTKIIIADEVMSEIQGYDAASTVVEELEKGTPIIILE